MDKSLLQASEVIARRLPLLAGEAAMLPGVVFSNDRRESERMVSEKLAAFGEGMVEASFKVAMLNFHSSLMALRWDAFGLMKLGNSAPKSVAHAFTKPGRRRLAANIRRLRSAT